MARPRNGANRQPVAAGLFAGRRVRVLTVARDVGSGVGGTEVLVHEIARRLDPEQFESYLCVTRRPEAVRRDLAERERAELERSGVRVLCLGRGSSWSLPPWNRLLRLMVRERIDVVHAHMPRASVPSTILARIARVPVVISHEHGSLLDGKRVRRFLDRNVVARGSDAVVVVSRWDRHQMIDVVHMPPSRVRVVPNGIDAVAPTGHDVRAEFGVAPDRALLAVVGRLTAQKCQADLLRAVAYLKAHGRPVSCLLVGDGPDRDALAALAGRLGIEEAIIFTGNRSDVPDVLAALDVAVLCSIWEGLPLAVMEYMAAGAPIVATAVGGVPELIDDGVHGLLVPPGDAVALAGAIARLLDDRRLAQRLGAAGRARQHAEFDLDNTVKQIEHLYLELCRASRRGRRRSVM